MLTFFDETTSRLNAPSWARAAARLDKGMQWLWQTNLMQKPPNSGGIPQWFAMNSGVIAMTKFEVSEPKSKGGCDDERPDPVGSGR
jgi:hypothetical protein